MSSSFAVHAPILLSNVMSRYITGSVVSSLYHLKDVENSNKYAAFFIFPGVSPVKLMDTLLTRVATRYRHQS